MDFNDQSLRCTCANGHKIRASEKLAGRKFACPACGAPVEVPRPDSAAITDTGAVRILNDLESEFQETQQQQPRETPARTEKAAKPEPRCPRCSCAISKRDQVCPECKLILASGNRAFQRIYRAALRALK